MEDFTSNMKESGNMDWRAVDEYRPKSLQKLLQQHDMPIFDDAQLKEISLVWQRLTPWPDTCEGLKLLNKQYSTASLSNCYQKSLESLVEYSSLPFTRVLSADLFGSYKPYPEVYLRGAEEMDVRPEECALVAAHLSDLEGAKSCGFRTIYVERPLEEKNPELRDEGIPDLVVKEGDGGFIALAKLLGIKED